MEKYLIIAVVCVLQVRAMSVMRNVVDFFLGDKIAQVEEAQELASDTFVMNFLSETLLLDSEVFDANSGRSQDWHNLAMSYKDRFFSPDYPFDKVHALRASFFCYLAGLAKGPSNCHADLKAGLKNLCERTDASFFISENILKIIGVRPYMEDIRKLCKKITDS